jgi:WD40 repeat protein/energy-coupling factor transporter ATP-binding protein EcfA2
MSEAVKDRAWAGDRANFDRNLAVVIGIDRYKNPSIRNLSTAVSDAKAIADLLEQKYAYKQSDAHPQVIRLLDEAATLTRLQTLLTQTLPDQKLTEGDRLIVYFAGHGLPRSNEDGPEGYLVPHDADPTKPESFLAMRDISDALSKLACHHLLVILDCCFAGTFRWAGSRKAVPILETIRREHYYHFIRHPAWQVITSSAHDQEALDVARLQEDNRQPVANQPHSPFALALLEGLQPGDDPQRVKADLFPDGVVTAHELFVYLQSRVKALSGDQQAPGIYPLRRDYDKGEFIFTPPGFDPQALAEALPLNEENNPYRGLKSFDEKHAKFFFGRQALIDELAKRLAQPDQALTVVLGVSGSGKSSLVKAGLMPHLRNHQTEQQVEQWRMLDPMRPGEFPFTSLARVLLPIVNDSLLEQLAQMSFLDGIFQPLLEAQAEAGQDPETVARMKMADAWCSATPEAKLLLIEDYFAQLATLGNLLQQEQLQALHDRILAELEAVSHHLQQDPQYFSRAIATWSQHHPGVRLLLVIDQLEELLTRSQDDAAQRISDGNRQSPNPAAQQADVPGVSLPEPRSTEQKEWQKFLAVLQIAIAEQSKTLRLVLTLRSDFEPRFLSSTLELYWKEARFPVRAMTSDELRQAIENPALKQALYFEELKDGNLVSKLVDEVGQMPGALPLLSFTLSELYVRLYKRWQDPKYTGRTLLLEDYQALGGVAGALTRRATQEYDALDESHQATMRQVMLRMVAIEGGSFTRRRVQESELVYPSSEENERVNLVGDRLVHARLLVKGRETGESYVEPAHDFLVRGWDKLQEWVKENQGNLFLRERLTPQANDWYKVTLAATHREKDNSAIGLLWNNDPRLDQLEEISDLGIDNWLNDWETKFVKSSLARKQALEEDLREQLRREKKLRITAELREQAARVENLLSVNPKEALELAVRAIDQNLQNQKEGLLDQLLTPVQISLNKAVEAARLPNILIGHESEVTSVAFSPNNKLIASASYDGVIKLWDLTGNPACHPFKGEPSVGISSVSFSPDGQFVISGCRDGSIRLWNLEGEPIPFPCAGHQRFSVNSVAFSPDGQLIASGSDDTTICLWNLKGESIGDPFIGHKEIVTSITFSPDGERIVSGSKDGTIRLWDLNGVLVGQPFEQGDWVSSVAFSPDGKLIASGTNLSGAYIKVRLWDLDGKCVEQLFREDFGGFNSITFSPDGHWIIAGSSSSGGSNEILISGIKGNPISQYFHRYGSQVNSITFSSDGKWIVNGYRDGKVCLWDMQNSTLAPPLKEASFVSPAFSPDSKLFICKINNVCKLLHLPELSELNLEIDSDYDSSWRARITGVGFSPDRSYIVCVYSNFRVIAWNSLDKSILHSCECSVINGNLVTVSSDSNYVLVGSSGSDGRVCLWNLQENCVREILRDVYLESIAFSSDSKWIICNTLSSSYLQDLKGESLSQEFQQREREEERFTAVAISPNDRWIATGNRNNQVSLWNSEGKLIRQFPIKHNDFDHAIGIVSIAFSPNSHFIVSLNLFDICLWNLEGELICQPFSHTFAGTPSSITFSFDGKFIIGSNSVRGHGENKFRLWDLKGQLVDQVYIREVDWIESLTFSQDSKQIACGGYRGKVRVWDLDGNPLTQLFQEHDHMVTRVAFSPNNKLIASGDQQGTIYLRQSNWQSWLKICCDRLVYNFISENPEIDITKEICTSCVEYGWSKTDLAQIVLRQAGDLSRQDKAEIAAIKFNQALEILLVACREVQHNNSSVSLGCNSSVTPLTTKKEIWTVIKMFLKILSFGHPQLHSQKQKWFEAINNSENLFTSQELRNLFSIDLPNHDSGSKSLINRLRKFLGSKD